MRAGSAVRLPVLIAFPEPAARPEGWGRFEELSAAGARLSTLTALKTGEKVFLSFDLAGEAFAAAAAEVRRAETDPDGYCVAEAAFTDELCRRRLAKALADVLSRQ